jgi:hypothetical protein
MSTERVTAASEGVPTGWSESDDLFFSVVAELLSTAFLWGAATLLASYDPDDADDPAAALAVPRQSQPSGTTLPQQRSLAA